MDDKTRRDKAANIGDEALDLEVGCQRDAYVAEHCTGDPELERYVREYLADFKEILPSLPIERGRPGRPGQRVSIKLIHGRYRLIRKLGEGGMGKVFRAVDTENSKPVAIKFIRSWYALNETMRMRFVKEAHAAGTLDHPCIVSVHDIGQVKGALYIVMEYVRGTALANLISSPMSLRSRIAIIAQVADALGYAHAQGVLHRDVKPANIIVRADRSVKVVDFGLAEMEDGTKALGQDGTPPYMSPEQFTGGGVDGRSDIWSAGVTLFQVLTGTLPFRGRQEVLSAPAPALAPNFPFARELNAIFARALARDPRLRYRKADELGQDLRKVQQLLERLDTQPAQLPSETGSSADLDHSRETGESLLAASEPTPRLYVLPKLNFNRPPEGAVVAKAGVFAWSIHKKKFHEVRGGVIDLVGDFLTRIFPPLNLAAWVFIPLMWMILSIMMLGCSLLEIPERRPRCRNCRLGMRTTASWTALVKSREEMIFGFRDCMAALKLGLWEDAAKLLAIHKAQDQDNTSLFITPLRYHLIFFECDCCGDHAARLITDERIERQWEQQAKFEGAYRGNARPAPFMLARLAAALRGLLGMMPSMARNAWATSPAAICILAALLALAPFAPGFSSLGAGKRPEFRAGLNRLNSYSPEMFMPSGYVPAESQLSAVRFKTAAELAFARGEKNRLDGRFQDAVSGYSEAIRLKPDYPEAYAGRCSAYGFLSQQTLGLTDCNQALALYSGRCAAYTVFAKNWNSAAADLPGLGQRTLDCDQALGQTLGLAIAHNNRGWRLLNLGQYDSAALDFKEAERLNPQMWEALYGLGDFYARRQQYKQAVQEYDAAIRMNASDWRLFLERGTAFGHLEQYENAIPDLDKAARMNPAAERPHQALGIAYYTLQRFNLAVIEFSKAILANPKSWQSFDYRGKTFTALKGYDHAIGDFDNAIRLNPTSAESFADRGRAKEALGNSDGAAKDLLQANDLLRSSHK